MRKAIHISDAFNLVKDDIKKVEASFRENISSNVYRIKEIGDYVFTSGGKRFRPLVLLLSSRLCGYAGERHIPLSVIVEFIHTATLLHDDVVDNATLRRGSKSANRIWGNGASILVGDYLLSKAFKIAVNDGDPRILKALASTTILMAEGEMLQILRRSDINSTEECYLEVITNKTAVLFSAASRIPAILAGLPPEKEEALARYGMELGIAYQLIDDCLDYTSKDEKLGKAAGNDLKEGKITLPLIYTYRNSTGEEKKAIASAIASGGEGLTEVCGIMKKHGGIEYTMELARKRVEAAKKELEIFSPDVERAALSAVADFIVERTN